MPVYWIDMEKKIWVHWIDMEITTCIIKKYSGFGLKNHVLIC